MSTALTDLEHEALRDALADLGAAPLTAELEAHLASCPECAALRELLVATEAELLALPETLPSEELLMRTLDAAEAQRPVQAVESERALAPRHAREAGAVSTMLGALLSGVASIFVLLLRPLRALSSSPRRRALVVAGAAVVPLVMFVSFATFSVVGSERAVMLDANSSVDVPMPSGAEAPPPEDSPEDPAPEIPETTRGYWNAPTSPFGANLDLGDDGVVDELNGLRLGGAPVQGADGELDDDAPHLEGQLRAQNGAFATNHLAGDGRVDPAAYQLRLAEERPTSSIRSDDEIIGGVEGEGRVVAGLDDLVDQREGYRPPRDAPVTGASSGDQSGEHRNRATNGRDRWAPTVTLEESAIEESEIAPEEEPVPSSDVPVALFDDEDGDFDRGEMDSTTVDLPPAPVRRFLEERERTANLSFQPASGYWANTYLAGEPEARLVRERLVASGADLTLPDLAHLAPQPVDAPRGGAMGLAVHADRAAIDEETRTLVRVSLRGAERQGRRPALRTAFVLDLRDGLSDEATRQVRALTEAWSAARDGTDRTALYVAGPGGGEILAPSELRHGQVEVSLRRIFDEPRDGATRDLPTVVREAIESVGGDDALLGSAQVVLLTPSLSASDVAALRQTVHVGTLGGVSTSVWGLAHADTAHLDAVALAGHGRRRVALGENARDLVREEIEAVSRVVARALRLRIRLAPGVRLVDVVGSHSLDARQAQRVREEERSVDRRLARQLGIGADRGDDEDGIQIVIPAFYAGDTHTLLLDVVADGPGAIADVQLRYKDLVRVRNAETRASLRLRRGERDRGALERGVLRNLLAHRLAAALRDASMDVRRGNVAGARSRLEEERLLLRALPDLVRSTDDDLRLTRGFADALSAPAPDPTIADALELAAHRRLHAD